MTATTTFTYVLEAVQETIRHLGLEGMSPSSVYVRKFPWDTKITHPAAFLSPVVEQVRDATNCEDDYGYGVQVTLSKGANRQLAISDDSLLRWRQRVMAAFHNQRLDAVGVSYQCKVEPGPVYDPVAFGQQYDASSFVIRCWTRQQRGTAQ